MIDSDILTALFSFAFGACIGSFLNVCIYRIPAKKSIVHPGSTCPGCGQPIAFYDNIPILSWLILRGRCRRCRIRIPFRYAFVEILGGCFALCTVLYFGPTPAALIIFGFIAALLVIAFIDLDHWIIPDVISLPGIPAGLLASLVLPAVTVVDAAIGVLLGGGSLYLIAWGYEKLKRGRTGMGGGDIKLLAMIGAFVGWQGVIVTIFTASLLGTLAGVAVMIRTRRRDLKLRIPFGPFLALGAITHIFFGPQLIRWYLTLS